MNPEQLAQLPPEQQVQALLQLVNTLSGQLQQHGGINPSAEQSNSSAKVPKPPFTDGHSPSPANWAFSMELYFRRTHTDPNTSEAVDVAAPYLSGPAQTWLRQYQQSVAAGRSQPFSSWPQLKTAFLSRFMPVDPETHARELVQQLSSTEHEDVAAYVEHFNDVMVELPHMHEADSIFFFTSGLPHDVRLHVRMQQPATLQQAMELAVQAGEATHDSYGASSSTTHSSSTPQATHPSSTPMELGSMRPSYRPRAGGLDIVCAFCEQPGHTFRNCRELAAMKREWRSKHAK